MRSLNTPGAEQPLRTRGRPASRRNCEAAPRLRPESMGDGAIWGGGAQESPGKNTLHERKAPLEESISPEGPRRTRAAGKDHGRRQEERAKPPAGQRGRRETPRGDLTKRELARRASTGAPLQLQAMLGAPEGAPANHDEAVGEDDMHIFPGQHRTSQGQVSAGRHESEWLAPRREA